jgi:Protein of unknown function (DUF2652)
VPRPVPSLLSGLFETANLGEAKVENKGLLFIPDISGFSRFVSQTEIEHSRLIIQELLETLINANQMGLEVSEVEGDAILFYRFGASPNLAEVYKQVERMFCEFHRHLLAYDQRRYCYCQACTAAIDLTLKVITHYGEFVGYSVKNFNKLIGKDVIVAHQLLKNDIALHEYWLVTPPVAGRKSAPAGFAQWMEWHSSTIHTENGEIPFHYTHIGQLKTELVPEPLPPLELSSKTKVLSFSREYDSDIRTLFHATGDFNYRSRWQEGVKTGEEIGHLLPRVGMKCRCVMEDGQVSIYSSSYAFSGERIEFSETDERKMTSTYFTLEKTGHKKTKLTIDFYLRKGRARLAWFVLTRRKKMIERYNKSLLNLERLVQEIKLPG